ncbi:ATP-binding protein [Bradyrhizobium sp. RT4b]
MNIDAVVETDDRPIFLFDLRGRVRNLSLPASPANSLIPLFEAVSNSLHAVEARYGDNFPEAGEVEIEVLRSGQQEDATIVGFVVRDNGIGLSDTNMKSFRTSDSPHKISKGGKGVGRLTWLKTFGDCEIRSWFGRDGKPLQRSFSFSLKQENPIARHTVTVAPHGFRYGTEVRLAPFLSPYDAHCPKRTATIAAKIVGHFLNYFAVGKLPRIKLIDSEVLDLRAFYTENQSRNDVEVLSLPLGAEEPLEFEIFHVLLKKQLRFHDSGGLHWLFQAGNGRVAKQEPIDSQLGLKYVGDNRDCVYVGLVTGKYLDSHVNQERTGFTFSDDDAKVIHKAAVDSAKQFLSDYIAEIRTRQIATADKLIRANPQFLPFRDGLGDFVENNLSLGTQGEEDIFLELSRRKLRAKRKLDSEITSLKNDGVQQLEQEIQRITKALNDEKKSSLAEYVVRRKEILELLDSSRAFADVEKQRYYKEEYIHELIVPIRSSSEELDYTQHNLWILDDRLAFYTFFRSDKPFKTYVDGSHSTKEPDVAIVFERALAFQREGRDEPIVIVEFKRPGRDDYDGNSSPVAQVLDYVDVFRSGTAVRDRTGKIIKPIDLSTRFICFVVADFTETLKKVIRSSVANNPTADGQGFFGYSREHNATVEVVPYDKVLHDARVRNEAFFSRLGLL